MPVEFDTDNQSNRYTSRTILGQAQVPGMVAWLIKKGFIKDESQAGKFLMGIVFTNIIITLAVLYYFVF